MAFVNGNDSGQKKMGIDFATPLHASCDKWLAHDGSKARVTELNFFKFFPCHAYFLAISFVFL